MELRCFFISLLVILCLLGRCCSGQCMFEYSRQPPSTTLNCCNPYRNGLIAIVLECTVRHLTNEFEIRWFRENTTGAVEDLGLGYPNISQKNMHWFSQYHGKNFINQQYNPSYLGKYWCQVINTTADSDQHLMRSNVFTLLAPENYTQPTCANQSNVTQTMKNITCADLPVHYEQTTLPAPTTTLTSYVSVNPNKYADCPIEYVVIHQKRRRKKGRSYSTSKEDNDGYNVNTASLQNLAIVDSDSSNLHAYEMPNTSEKQQQQKPEVVYSVVNLANKTKRKDNKDDKNGAPSPVTSGAQSTLDNPVYMTGCVGGLDHQYSSLNHQVQLSATTHDDQQSLQRDDTDSDGQYSKIKIDIYNQPFEDNN